MSRTSILELIATALSLPFAAELVIVLFFLPKEPNQPLPLDLRPGAVVCFNVATAVGTGAGVDVEVNTGLEGDGEWDEKRMGEGARRGC
jgi:hypothetical protein